MAEPDRNRPTVEARPRVRRKPDEWRCTLLRYVELPDGRMELQETPLTPEDFLDPQVGDTMVQGRPHIVAVSFLYDLLMRRFRNRADVVVLSDLKHLMGPRRGPAPDVSVIMGLKESDPEMESYDVRAVGVAPSLIIEVVSPSDRRIRRVDEVEKVELYERLGVREYLLLDLPRRANRRRLGWRGYRLDGRLGGAPRYAPIEPDARGRLHSETTGLFFGADPTGTWAELTDARTGERLLSSVEEEEGRRQAEEGRRQAEAGLRQAKESLRQAEEGRRLEAKARENAEAEVVRLREELIRFRGED
jgi:Uma2 family endonuclease